MKYTAPSIYEIGNAEETIQGIVKRTGPPDLLAQHRLIGRDPHDDD